MLRNDFFIMVVYTAVLVLSIHSCCFPFQECEESMDGKDSTRIEVYPYEVVWQSPIYEDTNFSLTIHRPIIFEDVVIFFRHRGPQQYEEIVAYDKRDGQIRWEWKGEVRNYDFDSNPIVLSDTLIIASGSQIYLIDMRTGRTIAEINEEIDTNYVPIGGLLTYFGGRLYQPYEREWKDNLTYIRSVDLKTYRWRTEVVDSSSYEGDVVTVHAPTVWVSENGDTILVSVKRIINYRDRSRYRCNLVSYNITMDTLLWERDSIELTGSTADGLRIEGERIYFIGDRHVECVNKYTGETIWRRKVVEGRGLLLLSVPVYTEDEIYLLSTDKYIISIRSNDGNLRYKRRCSSFGFYLSLHKGRLYRAHVSFDIIDAKSGRVLLTIKKSHNYSRRTPGKWSDGVVIDPETELMYVEDGFFAMCLTLPKVE